jgi:Mg-chelatase subunit ChlD
MSKSNDVRDAPIYKQFIEQANSVGAVAAARLGRVLASEAKKGWHDRLTSGHPDPRRLHMLASGTGIQVMRKPHDVEASDTAALLLIDQSGSMGGPKIHNAALAAYVFARVIEKAGHASAVCGFGYGGDYNKMQLYRARKSEVPVGVPYLACGTCLTFIKRWQHKIRQAERKFVSASINAPGGTPLYAATLAAYRNLVKRPERRKVMLVFTDGIGGNEVSMEQPQGMTPSQWSTLHHQNSAAFNFETAYPYLLNRCEEQGVEVALIGINTSVKTLHHRWAEVKKPKDLAETTVEQLTKCLTRKG